MTEHRRHLVEGLHAASREYDQAILAISGATLGLSVTFAHDITSTPVAGSVTFLRVAWLALLGSIITIVASFFTSQLALREGIRAVDRNDPKGAPSWPSWLTTVLNLLAGSALVAGLALLGTYALTNT